MHYPSPPSFCPQSSSGGNFRSSSSGVSGISEYEAPSMGESEERQRQAAFMGRSAAQHGLDSK